MLWVMVFLPDYFFVELPGPNDWSVPPSS